MGAELGIDLRQVAGSGPAGRIIKRDIEAYVQENAKKPEKKAAVGSPPMPIPSYEPTAEGYRVEPLSGMRQTIARRMVDSKQQAPHFYITTEIDMTPAMALRGQLNALLPEAEKISVNDLIVKAAALTLRQFPGVNAPFAADGIDVHDHVHVGVAVARENGLVTAVLRDCDKTSLAQLAIQARELVTATRGPREADDMIGATFTISEPGHVRHGRVSAIITYRRPRRWPWAR